jgi:hypothetical protein
MAIRSGHHLHLHSVHDPLVHPDVLQYTLPSKYHLKMLDRPNVLEHVVPTERI